MRGCPKSNFQIFRIKIGGKVHRPRCSFVRSVRTVRLNRSFGSNCSSEPFVRFKPSDVFVCSERFKQTVQTDGLNERFKRIGSNRTNGSDERFEPNERFRRMVRTNGSNRTNERTMVRTVRTVRSVRTGSFGTNERFGRFEPNKQFEMSKPWFIRSFGSNRLSEPFVQFEPNEQTNEWFGRFEPNERFDGSNQRFKRTVAPMSQCSFLLSLVRSEPFVWNHSFGTVRSKPFGPNRWSEPFV